MSVSEDEDSEVDLVDASLLTSFRLTSSSWTQKQLEAEEDIISDSEDEDDDVDDRETDGDADGEIEGSAEDVNDREIPGHDSDSILVPSPNRDDGETDEGEDGEFDGDAEDVHKREFPEHDNDTIPVPRQNRDDGETDEAEDGEIYGSAEDVNDREDPEHDDSILILTQTRSQGYRRVWQIISDDDSDSEFESTQCQPPPPSRPSIHHRSCDSSTDSSFDASRNRSDVDTFRVHNCSNQADREEEDLRSHQMMGSNATTSRYLGNRSVMVPEAAKSRQSVSEFSDVSDSGASGNENGGSNDPSHSHHSDLVISETLESRQQEKELIVLSSGPEEGLDSATESLDDSSVPPHSSHASFREPRVFQEDDSEGKSELLETVQGAHSLTVAARNRRSLFAPGAPSATSPEAPSAVVSITVTSPAHTLRASTSPPSNHLLVDDSEITFHPDHHSTQLPVPVEELLAPRRLGDRLAQVQPSFQHLPSVQAGGGRVGSKFFVPDKEQRQPFVPVENREGAGTGRGGGGQPLHVPMARGGTGAQVTNMEIEKLCKQIQSAPDDADAEEQPVGLNLELMEHQKLGLAWLLWRERQEPSGGILADDMGLGKTLSCISLCLRSRELEMEQDLSESFARSKWLSAEQTNRAMAANLIPSSGTVIVCPASLMAHWQAEIKGKCREHLRILLYHGPNRERSAHRLARYDFVLTSYTIVGREFGERIVRNEGKLPTSTSPLLRILWRRVCLDEAHEIRNSSCGKAIACCRLEARSRWALTGTPLQNKPADFYALIRFLRLAPFDTFEVFQAQMVAKKDSCRQRIQMLAKALILRRTKNETNQEGEPLVALPEKRHVLHEVVLEGLEEKVYAQLHQSAKSVVKEFLDEQEDRRKYGEADNKVSYSNVLVMILRCQQACNHFALLKDAKDLSQLLSGLEIEGMPDDGKESSRPSSAAAAAADDLTRQLANMSVVEGESGDEPTVLARGHAASAFVDENAMDPQLARIFDSKVHSTKLRVLYSQMQEIRAMGVEEGRMVKVVIVSQWATLLRIIGSHLAIAGYTCATIDGATDIKMRQAYVERFNRPNRNPEVMLLSLKAGGVGLNLIGGSQLFLIDLHWNPALEAQAADRIHRLGQLHDVTIHRFITKDSIEYRLKEVQDEKLKMAAGILEGAKMPKLSMSDLKRIFGIGKQKP